MGVRWLLSPEGPFTGVLCWSVSTDGQHLRCARLHLAVRSPTEPEYIRPALSLLSRTRRFENVLSPLESAVLRDA